MASNNDCSHNPTLRMLRKPNKSRQPILPHCNLPAPPLVPATNTCKQQAQIIPSLTITSVSAHNLMELNPLGNWYLVDSSTRFSTIPSSPIHSNNLTLTNNPASNNPASNNLMLSNNNPTLSINPTPINNNNPTILSFRRPVSL